MVRKGIITRDDKVRLIRDGVLVHEGKLASLKRVKDDLPKRFAEGFECGLVIKGYNDIKVGDFFGELQGHSKRPENSERPTKVRGDR